MRRMQLIILAVLSFIITGLLLPISVNLSTSYLPAISPSLDQWVKAHIIWFVIVTILFGLLGILLVILSIEPSLLPGHSSPTSEPDGLWTRVRAAIAIANADPTLRGQDNRYTMLKSWKEDAEALLQQYNTYKTRKDKGSRHIFTVTIGLIMDMTKSTERSFLFLNQKKDFIDIADLAGKVAYDQRKWVFAAQIAYEAGRVAHELGILTKSINLVDSLETYTKKAFSHNQWERVYRRAGPYRFDLPDECEALTCAAKLHYLEGLNAPTGEEAQQSFREALSRAENLPMPNKILFFWIKIHIGQSIPRFNRRPAAQHFTEALAELDALDLDALDHTKRSDVVHLKLLCYQKLAELAAPGLIRYPNDKIDGYQKLLAQAEASGRPDFQVLAHEGLANNNFLQGLAQASPVDAAPCFHTAYKHVKQAWTINTNFSREGLAVIAPNDLTQLMINIVDELMKRP